jgi:hypothetical protein
VSSYRLCKLRFKDYAKNLWRQEFMTEFEDEVIKLLKQILKQIKKGEDK